MSTQPTPQPLCPTEPLDITPTVTDPVREQVKTDRIQGFQNTARAELQRLIVVADEYHRAYTNAKTYAKRTYFKKKFDKVIAETKRVISTISVLDDMIKTTTEQHGNT